MTDSITLIRNKLMADRKVLCTGNPDNPNNIAHGVQKIWPDATFLSKSSGWDLTNFDETELIDIFKQHNTFINNSYIAPGVQKNLLDICNKSVKFCDVVNIGSTHELTDEGSNEYRRSKIELKEASLHYNTFRFQTTHVILGGIATESNPEWLNTDTIAETIYWCLHQEFKVPLISIIQPKQAW